MKHITIMFALLLVFGVAITLYTVHNHFNIENKIHQKECADLTVRLNSLNSTNHSCMSYYCYYVNYAPPKGLEATRTGCACECRLADGSTRTTQVLIPN
jgi:hypothetical protein